MSEPKVVLIQQGADVGGDVRALPDGDYFSVTVRILCKPERANAREVLDDVTLALADAGFTLVPGSAVDSRLIDRKRPRKRAPKPGVFVRETARGTLVRTE